MSTVEQRINLYQPAAAKAGNGPFSARTALQVLLVVVGCMGAVWGYGLWRVSHLERAVSSLQQQQQHQQETMAALNAARDVGTTPEQIEARVKELSLELAARSHALQMLHDGTLGRTSGFSRQLAALADHPVGGLWIDRVVLSGITGSMALGGAAVDPDLIPRFLQALGGDAGLAGARFDELVIERPRGDPKEPGAGAAAGGPETFKFRATRGEPVAAAQDRSS